MNFVSGSTAGARTRGQLIRMLNIVEANITNPVRVRDLAAAAALSYSHFCRAFRHGVGKSPRQYLRSRRIDLAQSLMLSTRKSLTEIALECGLCDQPHLTRTFRRIVGMTPAAWRRSRQAGPRDHLVCSE